LKDLETMTIKKVIVTNILETKSAFGVLEEDHKQNVFIPSKTFINCNADIGDTVSAIVVPNMQYPDKTPWLASRIVGQNITATQPELRLRVIAYLQEYDGTVEELASNLGINQSDIEHVLTDLARDGYLVSETVYSLKGAA
jgi:hypothetical protein